MRAILESHFISPAAFDILLRDPFTPADFEAFLAERQRTLQEAIEDLLVKERLDLPPLLREFDQEIEKTELSLRTCVALALSNDPERLPPHIAQKIGKMIQKAAKKNAAIDAANYRGALDQLQFADLRDLQETITSKATWAAFESRFANKETVNAKFGQLADLRNGIRHSRTVDEVTKKEGEAAILWFRQVLGK